MELLQDIKRRAYPWTSRYISRATLIEGLLEGAGRPFRCLIVDNSQLTEYLLTRHLGKARVVKQSRILIPSLPKYLDRNRDRIDLCMAVLPESAEYNPRHGFSFKTREYVHQVLDLSQPQEGLKKMYIKSKKTAQLIRKNGFSSRISRDPKDFDFFYHRIYLPHLLKQHGPYASIDDYEDLRSYFRRGFLLMVLDGGLPVSAQLCFVQGDTAISRRIGVLDGDETYVRKGVQSAAYYFLILHARENGIRKIDYMYSRPFFNDGVYCYKAHWGAAIEEDDHAEAWIHFFIPRLSEKTATFFQDNPVIIQTPKGPAGLVGHGGTDISSEDERDLKKMYYAPGLNHLLLLTPDRSTFRTISFSHP